MFAATLSKFSKNRRKAEGDSPSHTFMMEDHHRRKREELCKQYRHQQYFFGYSNLCN